MPNFFAQYDHVSERPGITAWGCCKLKSKCINFEGFDHLPQVESLVNCERQVGW